MAPNFPFITLTGGNPSSSKWVLELNHDGDCTHEIFEFSCGDVAECFKHRYVATEQASTRHEPPPAAVAQTPCCTLSPVLRTQAINVVFKCLISTPA
jgi:hypothetical protein